jgi:hypothetical protein
LSSFHHAIDACGKAVANAAYADTKREGEESREEIGDGIDEAAEGAEIIGGAF